MSEHKGHIFSGSLLIAGTCMGAGMLAIPLVTGISGFFPAILINTICWLFMTATGLLFLEATLWMPDGANVLSMAGRFFGPVGKVVGGLFFLFLYYCLMVAYIAGGAPLLAEAIRSFFHWEMTNETGYLIYVLLFGSIVAVGAWFIDRVNWIFMAGLVMAFLLIIGFGASDVNPHLLLNKKWKLCILAAPVLFSAYGYHNIIPSLSTYLRRNRRHLRIAVITGTTIPFIVYSTWQWLIIGAVPPDQLKNATELGIPVSHILSQITGSPWVGNVAMFFGFFAIVTSLLGVSMSMVDFLGDGFHIKKRTGMTRVGFVALVFAPPAFIAINNPNIFVSALGIAGGFGEAFLNGLLPIALVWVGRYREKLEGKHMLFGGRGVLSSLVIFTILIMAVEAWLLLS